MKVPIWDEIMRGKIHCCKIWLICPFWNPRWFLSDLVGAHWGLDTIKLIVMGICQFPSDSRQTQHRQHTLKINNLLWQEWVFLRFYISFWFDDCSRMESACWMATINLSCRPAWRRAHSLAPHGGIIYLHFGKFENWGKFKFWFERLKQESPYFLGHAKTDNAFGSLSIWKIWRI